ncbi:MAG: metallophosphoesterase family protein [Hahellaceae bacterium]|nr:metallophosphoesterase family protein [Hahellaceae bacterium]MCP5168607.1 metallophosphoesterase family protein [Hahellaceae bacterium]
MRIHEPIDPATLQRLEARLGKVHAHQRLGVEQDHASQVFGFGRNFFHLENWYSIHGVIRGCLRLVGLYRKGQNNCCNIKRIYQRISLDKLPDAFDGYRILHLSDLHVDMYPPALQALTKAVHDLEYDLCVMTGDYRARTFGDIESSLKGMRTLRQHLKGDVYAVLGNHDSIRMVPELEDMGFKLLLNENTIIEKAGQKLMLAGIDDAHYFRVDNIEKAANGLDTQLTNILLSHTPAVFKQAAHAGFDVFFCGHTHGGQICLPGGIPITLDSDCPRSVGKGAWQYHQMQGYTSVGAGSSVVNVRLNCFPEITLHHLRKARPTRD